MNVGYAGYYFYTIADLQNALAAEKAKDDDEGDVSIFYTKPIVLVETGVGNSEHTNMDDLIGKNIIAVNYGFLLYIISSNKISTFPEDIRKKLFNVEGEIRNTTKLDPIPYTFILLIHQMNFWIHYITSDNIPFTNNNLIFNYVSEKLKAENSSGRGSAPFDHSYWDSTMINLHDYLPLEIFGEADISPYAMFNAIALGACAVYYQLKAAFTKSKYQPRLISNVKKIQEGLQEGIGDKNDIISQIQYEFAISSLTQKEAHILKQFSYLKDDIDALKKEKNVTDDEYLVYLEEISRLLALAKNDEENYIKNIPIEGRSNTDKERIQSVRNANKDVIARITAIDAEANRIVSEFQKTLPAVTPSVPVVAPPAPEIPIVAPVEAPHVPEIVSPVVETPPAPEIVPPVVETPPAPEIVPPVEAPVETPTPKPPVIPTPKPPVIPTPTVKPPTRRNNLAKRCTSTVKSLPKKPYTDVFGNAYSVIEAPDNGWCLYWSAIISNGAMDSQVTDIYKQILRLLYDISDAFNTQKPKLKETFNLLSQARNASPNSLNTQRFVGISRLRVANIDEYNRYLKTAREQIAGIDVEIPKTAEVTCNEENGKISFEFNGKKIPVDQGPLLWPDPQFIGHGLSTVLDEPIFIFNALVPNYITTFSASSNNKKGIYLLYNGKNHYDALIPQFQGIPDSLKNKLTATVVATEGGGAASASTAQVPLPKPVVPPSIPLKRNISEQERTLKSKLENKQKELQNVKTRRDVSLVKNYKNYTRAARTYNNKRISILTRNIENTQAELNKIRSNRKTRRNK